MTRLARDGTAEPVSRDQICRREQGQGNAHFPCSAGHEQVSNHTRLIHTLLYVMTIYAYIHIGNKLSGTWERATHSTGEIITRRLTAFIKFSYRSQSSAWKAVAFPKALQSWQLLSSFFFRSPPHASPYLSIPSSPLLCLCTGRPR